MRNETVETGVILDVGQIAVVLDGHQRVGAEGLQGECTAG